MYQSQYTVFNTLDGYPNFLQLHLKSLISEQVKAYWLTTWVKKEPAAVVCGAFILVGPWYQHL